MKIREKTTKTRVRVMELTEEEIEEAVRMYAADRAERAWNDAEVEFSVYGGGGGGFLRGANLTLETTSEE